jgi:hypothetical protein
MNPWYTATKKPAIFLFLFCFFLVADILIAKELPTRHPEGGDPRRDALNQ